MVRASSSKKPPIAETAEATERKRLKKLALKNNLVSDTAATPKSFVPLSPSKLVMKHHGKDILRKSQRKNRFLFSFPGLLAPISGGKIGELKNLGSKNPILYLDFPQGQMKLFGTIVYPKNRYLTLLFSRGGKNVMCEDYFDNMIVFSDAWWIGKKDENPEEARLDFPKELCQGQQMEYDFKGGAGVESVSKQETPRTEIKQFEIESLDNDSGDALSDDDNDLTTKMEVTPTRHSTRNAGKRFKFVEASSEDDPIRSDAEPSDGEEKKVGKKLDLTENDTIGKTISSAPLVLRSDSAEDSQISEQIQTSLTSASKSRKISKSTVTVTKSKENSKANRGSLVQPTISTLFKKVEEKVWQMMIICMFLWFLELICSAGLSLCDICMQLKFLAYNGLQLFPFSVKICNGYFFETVGTGTKRKKKESEDEEEDVEEISSTSEDANGSDEDWTA
ncbi:DNA-binding protein RHL1 [Herrania umbratica]|uniref:DNA-binding protein RHL1 n=1 Tax=Herrania umbratica TaxID=108875 RepID=A0A6J1A464_9ROSI|nr:DNA-binding protein RHL1 [Herrania umbratica]